MDQINIREKAKQSVGHCKTHFYNETKKTKQQQQQEKQMQPNKKRNSICEKEHMNTESKVEANANDSD